MNTCNGGAARTADGILQGTGVLTGFEDHAGGVWRGRRLKAVIPGGSSVPVLPASAIDVPFTYGAVKAAGSLAGAAGVIVMPSK